MGSGDRGAAIEVVSVHGEQSFVTRSNREASGDRISRG
jgi:hypothetical protein